MFEEISRPLTPKEEEELIDKIAKQIVRLGLETPAIFFLEANKPLTGFEAQTLGLFGAPFLDIVGINGWGYYKLFSKEGTVEKLIQKVEELSKKKK